MSNNEELRAEIAELEETIRSLRERHATTGGHWKREKITKDIEHNLWLVAQRRETLRKREES